MRFPDKAKTRGILTKRVRRLLRLEGEGNEQSELSREVLPFLKSLGSVALIGGAIRDVARAGKRGFSSDLDFVVYGSSRSDFSAQMARSNGVRNRFGGYALNGFSVKVDVWHIEDTWAKTAGFASVAEPADLLKCTFFDWDSAVFEIDRSRLIVPSDYFERLSQNVMDICLEVNPNREGSLVRALRRAAMWNVRFGPKLTAFARRSLETMDWNELIALDARAFARPLLKYLDRAKLMIQLDTSLCSPMGPVTLPVPAAQLSLPISEETTSW